MRFYSSLFARVYVCAVMASVAFAATPHKVVKQLSARKTSAHSARSGGKHTVAHGHATPHGKASSRKGAKHSSVAASHSAPVQRMEPERATAIQSALIRSGYLSGEPSGTWDSDSVAAMQKMQKDNGWQTKVVPDARAIIKLGLGPQH